MLPDVCSINEYTRCVLAAKEGRIYMSTARFWKAGAIALAVVALAPAAALAQSSISGQVTDNTGGVLPGVTVEASSPDMIEGSRVVVTDGTGQYNVTSLRPGTYAVTFTLPGFGTQVRDELVLAAASRWTSTSPCRSGRSKRA